MEMMGRYRLSQPDLNGKVYIDDLEEGRAFNGYDFMGSATWEEYGGDAYWMDVDEAVSILRDLIAAE